MIIPDANLLLYAYNSDSPFHKRAANWWESCLSGDESVGLCSAVLYSFIRIATSARVYQKPLTIEEASTHIRSWMDVAVTEFITGDYEEFEKSVELLLKAGAGGNLTTDAQIASLGIKYNAVIHSADSDFARFPEVNWVNPILEA